MAQSDSSHSDHALTMTPHLKRLSAKIDQVILQLNQQYTFDREAIKAKRALAALKSQLASEEHTHPIRIPDAIREFAVKKNDHVDSILFPFYIAFAEAFPGNRKTDGHWVTFKDVNDYEKRIQTPITQFRDQVIPTTGILLHFTQFVIDHHSFYWRDKLSAVYYDIKRGIVFNKRIQLEDHLFITGQKEPHPIQTVGPVCLHQGYISYYYYMIQQGMTKAHMLFWNESLQSDPSLGTFINLLCEYQLLAQEASYAIEDKLAKMGADLLIMLDAVIAHPMAEQYLEINLVDTLAGQIGRLLSNLTSTVVYDKQLTLSAALKLSETQHAQFHTKFQAKKTGAYEANPVFLHYQKLSGHHDFQTFLGHIHQSSPEFFESLCSLSENDAITVISCFSQTGVMPILSSAIALLIPQKSQTVAIEKIFNIPKLAALVNTIQSAHYMLGQELSQFIDEYNQEDPNDLITLTNREKNKLQHLSTFSQDFDTVLQQSKLAYRVLSQHGCSSLIAALAKYGDLADRLKQKRFKEITLLAENFCKNIKGNILLHAIDLGLDPEKALGLDGNHRKSWIRWSNGLYDIIKTTYGDTEHTPEDCERYIAQRIPLLLLQHDTSDSSVEDAMQDDRNDFDTLVFTGLFQCRLLSLDEIFSLSPDKVYHFARISNRLSKQHKRIVEEARCSNPVEIIAKTDELKQQRAALNQLKHKADQNKEAKAQYLSALDNYVECLLVHIRVISINLHSIYGSFVNELAELGIKGVSLQQTLSLAQQDLVQLKEDREQGRHFFNSQLKIFESAKISNVSDLLKAIVAAKPTIKVHEVYNQGLQVTKLYSTSKTMNVYYAAGLLDHKQLFTLTPAIFQLLRQRSKYFLSIQEAFPKAVFKEIVMLNIYNNRADIEEDFEKILPYLELDLLLRIVESTAIPTKKFINEAFKENTYSGDLEDDWIDRLDYLHKYTKRSISSLLKKQYNRSRIELLADVYHSDPRFKTENFSFNHIIQSMERYLSNLEHIFCQTLIEAGYSPLSVMHLSEEEVTQISAHYKNLETFLTTQTLNVCMQRLQQTQPIRELPNILEHTYKTFQNTSLPASLRAITQTLSDATKQFIDQAVVTIIMTHKHLETTKDVIKQLAIPIVQTLIGSQKFTVDEILTQDINDLETLQSALDVAMRDVNIIQLMNTLPSYKDVTHLLTSNLSSRVTADHIVSTLTTQLARLTQEEQLRHAIEAGITPKNAFHLSLASRPEEIEEQRNRRVHDFERTDSRGSYRTSRRHSSSRRVSGESYKKETQGQRHSIREVESKPPSSYKKPARGGFFSMFRSNNKFS